MEVRLLHGRWLRPVVYILLSSNSVRSRPLAHASPALSTHRVLSDRLAPRVLPQALAAATATAAAAPIATVAAAVQRPSPPPAAAIITMPSLRAASNLYLLSPGRSAPGYSTPAAARRPARPRDARLPDARLPDARPREAGPHRPATGGALSRGRSRYGVVCNVAAVTCIFSAKLYYRKKEHFGAASETF